MRSHQQRKAPHGAFFVSARAWLLLCALFLLSPVQAGGPPAVASAHPQATEAGLEILAEGGNAFDAAVAVSAALAVVEPYSSGLGGGGFWLLDQKASDRQVMVDGRETAPGQATPTMYQDASGEVIPEASIDGPLAAGIPGMPAALVHLSREYGALNLSRSLEPAIRLAREGFAVDEHYRRMARFRLEALRASPEAAQAFLVGGEVPEAGHIIRQPELAETLERIASQGLVVFSEGPVAKRLVAGVCEAVGIWTRQDLADYRVVEREPIRFDYHDMEVVSAAPPSSGGVALAEMFHILEGFELESLDEAERVHLVVEAMRRAYRDRAEHLGDPDFHPVPVKRLTDPAYAAGLRASIRRDQATPSSVLPGVTGAGGGRDTTHFSILDAEGNRVAATLSINYPFGSAFMPPGTGVLLNDEMDDFSAKPGVPNVYGLVGGQANAIRPGKRMLSSMSPTFLEKDGRMAVIGTPGGSRIITMVLLGSLAFHEGADARAIVGRPRFHHQYLPDVIELEPGALADDSRDELTLMGHQLEESGRTWGNMQVITGGPEGVSAASDPRGVGAARVGPH